MAHENWQLNVPSIRWIGVKCEDICSDSHTSEEQGLLRLTARDRRKAVKMLEEEIFAEDGLEMDWSREMHVMLMLNIKAEIQILSEREGGLERWLEARLTDESGSALPNN